MAAQVGKSLTLEQAELYWPAETRLMYNTKKKINKREQSDLIKQLLERVIEEFTIDFAFERAIYSADRRFLHQRALVQEIAKALGAQKIQQRLVED